jgi:hypothetical protein
MSKHKQEPRPEFRRVRRDPSQHGGQDLYSLKVNGHYVAHGLTLAEVVREEIRLHKEWRARAHAPRVE